MILGLVLAAIPWIGIGFAFSLVHRSMHKAKRIPVPVPAPIPADPPTNTHPHVRF